MATQEVINPADFEVQDFPKPLLPVENTAELIRMIGDEWRMPTYEEIRANNKFPVALSTSPGGLIKRWQKFFALVEKADEDNRRVAEKGEVQSDSVAMGASQYAREVIGGDYEQRKKMILATKRAFQVLLGEEVEMESGDVDQARKLVKAFEDYWIKESSTASAEGRIEPIK
jgi:hypothetical protein